MWLGGDGVEVTPNGNYASLKHDLISVFSEVRGRSDRRSESSKDLLQVGGMDSS